MKFAIKTPTLSKPFYIFDMDKDKPCNKLIISDSPRKIPRKITAQEGWNISLKLSTQVRVSLL